MRHLTIASFQSLKKCPMLNERLTTLVNASIQCVRTFLRNFVGIMSSSQVVDGISIIILYSWDSGKVENLFSCGILVGGWFVVWNAIEESSYVADFFEEVSCKFICQIFI